MSTNLRQVTVAELTAVADEIRDKGSTAAPLYWPNGFIQAIHDISGGGDVNWKNEMVSNLAGAISLIPDTVKNLRDYCFYAFTSLTNAFFEDLPAGLETIGDYGFGANTGITLVDLSSKSLKSIGDYAFTGCDAVTKIDLSDNDLTTLGSYMCPDSVTFAEIDLSDNPNLKIIPANFAIKTGNASTRPVVVITNTPIEVIGDSAFRDTASHAFGSLSWLEGCTTLTTIGQYAFYSGHSGLVAMLDLSGTALETIGASAFEHYGGGGTAGFEAVKFPTSIESIGVKAFYLNRISSIDFTGCSALETIGNYAFRQAGNTTGTSLDLSDCTSLDVIGEYAFGENAQNHLTMGTLKLPPQKLSKIGQHAFRQMGLANQSTIDSGKLTIRASDLGANSFIGCTGIKKAYLEFDKCGIAPLSGCTGITELHMLNTPTGPWPSNMATYPVCWGCTGVTDIYVPWAQGTLPESYFFRSQDGSPTWHYNYVE